MSEHGILATQVGRDMAISANLVSRWVREANSDKVHAFAARGQQRPEDAEIARLELQFANTAANQK